MTARPDTRRRSDPGSAAGTNGECDGHWEIEELFSTNDRVVVRWTGSGTHVGEVNGIPPTNKPIRVDAISIHRMEGGKIAESWEVWDTLGFLQQIGVVPS